MPTPFNDNLDPKLTMLPQASKFKPQTKSAAANLLGQWADRMEQTEADVVIDYADPADWISANFYVDRPRSPIDARMLPAGPVQLAEYQKRVLREALRRDGDGKLIYSTVVWSEPKKSGKTAIAAAAGLYMASQTPAANIYCLANDGKQSADRIFNAMARCIELHQLRGGIYKHVKPLWTPPKIRLPNSTVIEAIPCDAQGEAGSEPLMTIYSELWGYTQEYKERLWTEMTIPPTLFGLAIRWVESYAGYEDESTTLYQLYDTAINHSRQLWPDLPVFVNDAARQLTFWSHEPRQPWQSPEYYAAESKTLRPDEFRRIHKNEWVSSVSSLFEDITAFDLCADPKVAITLPEGDLTPIAVSVDASISGDCCAIVAVSRHPDDAWDAEVRRVIERYSQIWTPEKGEKIDYEATLVPCLRWLCANYNVWKVVYDEYQLHKLATDLAHEGIAAFSVFNQHNRRAVADKQWYDMVINRQFIHTGGLEQRKHVMNAAAKLDGKTLRIVKKVINRPIDWAVAASMATDEILRLNV